MRPRMWSACSSMMRKNSRISAGSSSGEAASTVVVEPLMEVSGARSSWLTRPKHSARWRSSSSSGARSCMVTTTDSTAPSLEWIGAALTSVVTLRPSGTDITTSSPRLGVASRSTSASGSSSRAISLPSANRHVITFSKCSGGWPEVRRLSTIRVVSRLNDTGLPVRASKTATPTGEMSTRVSRSVRARCSSRCLRALAIVVAACAANNATTSSSSLVNSAPSSLSLRKRVPR